MMNAARFGVGLEGVAIAERAYQRALAYAKERVQGRDLAGGGKAGADHPPSGRAPHADDDEGADRGDARARLRRRGVRWTSRSAIRTPRCAQRNQAFVDLMIPVVKGWSTETGIEVASLGIQVHGGMGFIEETGAAQHLRDARITTIYEGTTGIQANDLVGRKIAREAGATVKGWLGLLRGFDAELAKSGNADIRALRAQLAAGATAVGEAVDFILAKAGTDPRVAFAGAVPFLKLMGIVAGGWQMARAALAAERRLASGAGDKSFYEAKIATARFFGDYVLTQAPGLRASVVEGGAAVMALSEDQFLAA